MGDIVNLRRVRRAKAREAEAVEAAENRRRSGLTKAERERTRQEREMLARTLESARLDTDPV